MITPMAWLPPILITCLCPALRAQGGNPAPPRASSARELTAQEKRSPTTAKNARQRYEALVLFLMSSGAPERYLPRDKGLRIQALLEKGRAEAAAPLVHAAILGLEKGRPHEGEDAGGAQDFAPPGPGNRPIGPPGPEGEEHSEAQGPLGGGLPELHGSPRDDMRAIERLVGEEKTSPTTERTIVRRHREFLRAILDTGDPIRYSPPGEMSPIDELLYRKNLAQAAAEFHAVILKVGERLSSGGNGGRDADGLRVNEAVLKAPSARENEGAAAPSAPSAADKAGAATLYGKAMQDYADGKPDRAWNLLQGGVKLDPGNQDIAKAVERLAKER